MWTEASCEMAAEKDFIYSITLDISDCCIVRKIACKILQK